MFAIFFPQFCSTPVNSQSWGFAFTDWVLVQYANAQNIWRRRMPARGAYSLGHKATIRSILEEINQTRLEGIALYSYYFSHGKELNAVEDFLLLKNQEINIPYFLIWANEPWTKRWIGSNEVIADLGFLDDPTRVTQHCQYLASHFSNTGYKKTFCGRPIFCLYEPFATDSKGNPAIHIYKDCFRRINIDPFFVAFVKRPQDIKFLDQYDGAYIFMPRYFFALRASLYKLVPLGLRVLPRIWSLLLGSAYQLKKATHFKYSSYLRIIRGNKYRKFLSSIQMPISTVRTCGWNNLPRYGTSRFTRLDLPTKSELHEQENILSNYDQTYNSLHDVQVLPSLINAWNEWSEGAAIEPCHYLKDFLLENTTR